MFERMSAKDRPNPRKEFGRRLRWLRYALGEEDPNTGRLSPLTQKEMADILGVPEGTYQKNESIGAMPRLEALQRLIAMKICGPGYLLTGQFDNPKEIQKKIDRARREHYESERASAPRLKK